MKSFDSEKYLSNLTAVIRIEACIETAISRGFNDFAGRCLLQNINEIFEKYKGAIAAKDVVRVKNLEGFLAEHMEYAAKGVEKYLGPEKSGRISANNEPRPIDLPSPPTNATKLMYLVLSSNDRDHVIGDLDETYRKLTGKFDERYARQWYWSQTIRTVTLYPLQTALNYLRQIIVGVVSNLLGP